MERGKRPGAAAKHAALDALVLAIARDRDRGAFAELFRHFAPRVKSYLVRLGADAPAAEELMQEVMATVWRRAESFDPDQAGVATWIFTIARNKRIDALRRERHPAIDPSDPALVPSAPDPAEAVAAATEIEGRLRRALRSLPPEQAELVRMAYFDDQSHSAIAERTRLPLGTVKSRLRLALERLRRLLADAA